MGRDLNKTIDNWSIFHVNIRNLDARRASLESILNKHKFSTVILNETHFQGGRKVKLPNYLTYTRNRIGKACGGISTSVINSESSNCVKVDKGKDQNEFILTRHSQFETPINVRNIYGQQEC